MKRMVMKKMKRMMVAAMMMPTRTKRLSSWQQAKTAKTRRTEPTWPQTNQAARRRNDYLSRSQME